MRRKLPMVGHNKQILNSNRGNKVAFDEVWRINTDAKSHAKVEGGT